MSVKNVFKVVVYETAMVNKVWAIIEKIINGIGMIKTEDKTKVVLMIVQTTWIGKTTNKIVAFSHTKFHNHHVHMRGM